MTDHAPEASAVEALAEVFRAALIDQYAVVIPEMDPEWAAEIVIASDWLAEHTRRAQAQALREASGALAERRDLVPEIAVAAEAAFATSIDILSDRADRIENGDSRE